MMSLATLEIEHARRRPGLEGLKGAKSGRSLMSVKFPLDKSATVNEEWQKTGSHFAADLRSPGRCHDGIFLVKPGC